MAGIAARYIPQATVMQDTGRDTFLDLEASVNCFAAYTSKGDSDTTGVDLYRLKFRLATPRTEARIGLQQINFGPAYLLRSLRWFDRLDPRDPMGLTEGVYALSLRYVTQSNASVWLWALYGNEDTKGYEVLPTAEDTPEFGGRLQVPIPSGEIALAYHRREVEGPELASPMPALADFPECRVAIDGRWDVRVGLWLEAVLIRQQSDALPYPWTQMVTLGVDYTLPVGNGPHVLLENMLVDLSEEALKIDQDSYTSGLSLDYPVGYMDRLSAIGVYYWDEEDYSLYLAWNRYWDAFTVTLSAFHYPETGNGAPMEHALSETGGTGGRITLVFNH
jgi:hypothetical protein